MLPVTSYITVQQPHPFILWFVEIVFEHPLDQVNGFLAITAIKSGLYVPLVVDNKPVHSIEGDEVPLHDDQPESAPED